MRNFGAVHTGRGENYTAAGCPVARNLEHNMGRFRKMSRLNDKQIRLHRIDKTWK